MTRWRSNTMQLTRKKTQDYLFYLCRRKRSPSFFLLSFVYYFWKITFTFLLIVVRVKNVLVPMSRFFRFFYSRLHLLFYTKAYTDISGAVCIRSIIDARFSPSSCVDSHIHLPLDFLKMYLWIGRFAQIHCKHKFGWPDLRFGK